MADSAPQKRHAITDLERLNIRRRGDTTSETQKERIACSTAFWQAPYRRPDIDSSLSHLHVSRHRPSKGLALGLETTL
jgi:hypothetical protein